MVVMQALWKTVALGLGEETVGSVWRSAVAGGITH